MKTNNYITIFFLPALLNGFACRQPYLPPVAKADLGYLVVDGIIIDGQDSTIINLSRTQNITDSTYRVSNPEPGAVVSVVGANGDSYNLTEQSSGRYVTDQLALNANELYRLKIVTTNGKQYLSDSVPVKQTPPIDSVFWRQDSVGVNIYLTTHDPSNNTRFYRWNYAETWEYTAFRESDFDWINNQTVLRDSTTQIYHCWSSENSSSITIGSSAKLSQDVISQDLLTEIPTESEKLNKEYSILVNQYAITADEFDYLQTTKTYTEELGGLFDPQPSRLTGNIHCVSNPAEPVLGYINASSVSSARIFIHFVELTKWNYTPYYSGDPCRDTLVPSNNLNSFLPATGQRFYVFIAKTTIGNDYILTTVFCGDCRIHGGSNIKPAFWQ
jgi:hypothetical protein